MIRTGAACAGEDDADGIGQEVSGGDVSRLSRGGSTQADRESATKEQRLDAGGLAEVSFPGRG